MREVDPAGRAGDLIQTLTCILEIHTALELVQRLDRLVDARFELTGLETHRNNFVIDGSHQTLVTSLHASAVIWSNIGLIAGVM